MDQLGRVGLTGAGCPPARIASSHNNGEHPEHIHLRRHRPDRGSRCVPAPRQWHDCRVEREISFRTDLYRGTAPFYDRYRPPYPEALLDDLCGRLPVSGGGRLLDLACGTGQIAFSLAGRFADVVAVDQEEQSVAYGRAKAEAAPATNICWVAGSAEKAAVQGPFELVAVGNAFHRLDRQAVAHRMFSWVQAAGGVALLWGGTPWQGDQGWQAAMRGLFEQWMTKLGATDRVPAGWQQAMDSLPHEQVLAAAGFDYVGKFEFIVEQAWTVEALTGFVYSTSFLNRAALGERAEHFERDVAGLLCSYEPEGVFQVPASYAYQLARKPMPNNSGTGPEARWPA
jgi:SAM-dependent methyltransferase